MIHWTEYHLSAYENSKRFPSLKMTLQVPLVMYELVRNQRIWADFAFADAVLFCVTSIVMQVFFPSQLLFHFTMVPCQISI